MCYIWWKQKIMKSAIGPQQHQPMNNITPPPGGGVPEDGFLGNGCVKC